MSRISSEVRSRPGCGDRAVRQGKAKSRDEFILRAIRNELAALKRAEIGAELAEEVLQMESEFAAASWEAFQLVSQA